MGEAKALHNNQFSKSCLSSFPQPLGEWRLQSGRESPFGWPTLCKTVFHTQLPPLTILHFTGMSHSSGSSGSTPKPNYNKHFPHSFMLNFEEALSNLSDDKILCRLFDWNCEWLSRPNIAISEMASMLKDNWSNIMAYCETVLEEDFVDDLRRFVDPITDTLRRVDNKDKLDTDPPDAKDVLQILKAINFDPWVEDLFTDAFNAVGPMLMMSIHVLVINCLMHNPDAFAERSVRAPTAEKFKAHPTFKNMMKYLIDQILMRRRTIHSHKWLGFCGIFAGRGPHQSAAPEQIEKRPCASPSNKPRLIWRTTTSRRHVPSASTGRYNFHETSIQSWG